MRISKRVGVFPLFTIFTGALGYAARYWLLSLTDESTGLLPKNHFCGIATVILFAVTVLVSFLAVRNAPRVKDYEKLFPPSLIAAVGGMVGALGLGVSAFAVKGIGVLAYGLPIFGILSTVALVYAAWCRFTGHKLTGLIYGVVVVFFMLRLVAWCRVWGTEPQLHNYLFELLASLFLLMAAYYRAKMPNSTAHYRRYAFFSQMALFCCMLCLTDGEWMFYLSAGIWMASDFCALPAYTGRYE
jgi:hypothetical protein